MRQKMGSIRTRGADGTRSTRSTAVMMVMMVRWLEDWLIDGLIDGLLRIEGQGDERLTDERWMDRWTDW